ncbi:Helicase conserved C-terminal domain-containing protein [Nocardioides terrae]|uniref:Helicase conserved C-terminal domain-containing protein n=1 Tax=Nocardioides terrae TaxID=574651 RepID=A0A1I1JSJ4_9ACTN|nr:Helicase conserved C-terminal domain-containing protein [Nocardioides terrae]
MTQEEFRLAAQGQRRSSGARTAQRRQGGARRAQDNEGLIPVLAKAVREVESGVQRGRSERTRFQVVALLVREERARLKADPDLSEQTRAAELKRLDGIASILAQTAAREPSLFTLLAEDAEQTDATRRLRRELQEAAGLEPDPATEEPARQFSSVVRTDRQVVPQSVARAQLITPFMAPDFSAAPPRLETRRLAGWEMIGPLLNSFEHPAPGVSSCMELPTARPSVLLPPDVSLMDHQSRLVASVADGHRTFLLADEPGLGKTAQSLLAAQAAQAYPLLVVVPNVVKTNWAREARIWTPQRTVSVVHGDGADVDGFADIIVLNYEILDRHVGWIGEHGFRGMIVDEAHFIKNKKSQRSQHVLEIAERIRQRVANPLMMALTGTPLINDVEDFLTIWQFLGWVTDKSPRPALMARLEETGMTPADFGFYPAARRAVVDMGIVRRRKVDVAADIPARRIADLPVELDDADGRSIRAAERELAARLVKRYDSAVEARREHRGVDVDGIDHELVRRVAGWELSDGEDSTKGDNIFAMVRRIGQAKAGLAADYAAQLVRSAGKVVFFAKHLDVMDAAGEVFAKRDIRYTEIRGDQSASARTKAIDSFVKDPGVGVIVCSLTAAGVGINLQVASDVVLAELSWTDAEQTQAIDRVHRIGQTEPVTAWRIIAAQTIDSRIAELIDSKAGLAAVALDGASEEETTTTDIRLEALVTLLTDALGARGDAA